MVSSDALKFIVMQAGISNIGSGNGHSLNNTLSVKVHGNFGRLSPPGDNSHVPPFAKNCDIHKAQRAGFIDRSHLGRQYDAGKTSAIARFLPLRSFAVWQTNVTNFLRKSWQKII